jgi:hypothetical protein
MPGCLSTLVDNKNLVLTLTVVPFSQRPPSRVSTMFFVRSAALSHYPLGMGLRSLTG